MIKRIPPSLKWGGAALLLLLMAMLVPTAWVENLPLIGSEREATVFTDDVAATDHALRQGTPPDLTPQELEAMRPLLQARRLLGAGPMTSEENQRAVAMLREFDATLKSQAAAGAQDAIREERVRALSEAFPRLDPERIASELAQLEDELRLWSAGF